MFGDISISSTGHDLPLLYGNLTSIISGFLLVILGSIIKPDNFNFNITKQRIVVVDEKIRSVINEDQNDFLLKKASMSGYKYGILITLFLVILWPLPLFFSAYVFSYGFFLIWICLGIGWIIIVSSFLIFKPIVESKNEIKLVFLKLLSIFKTIYENKNSQNPTNQQPDAFKHNEILYNKRILVAIDGSIPSIKAIEFADRFFSSDSMIYVLYVIEWNDDIQEEVYDSELLKK